MRSYATSRGTAGFEGRGLRPSAGAVSAISIVEPDRKPSAPAVSGRGSGGGGRGSGRRRTRAPSRARTGNLGRNARRPVRGRRAAQLAERTLWTERRDRGAPIALHVSRDDVPSVARPARRDLHRVLEVRHRKRGGTVKRLHAGRCHRHEPGQLDDEGARTPASSRWRDQMVEVRDGMPSDERVPRSLLDPVEKLRGRVRMGAPIERQIDENVGVRQHQRYFRASAS